MAEGTSDRTWVDVQKKTFTRWSNNFLSERILKINDLALDLEDGIMLINLLEIISSKSLGKYNKKATIKPQKLENNSLALRFIRNEGLKLVAIGPEDIVDHNLKLILGLIWTLILRYQIQKGGDEGSPKWELLEWVRKQVAPYGMKPNNFTDDWRDGKLLSALTDSLKPGVIDMNTLSNNALKDTQHAMNVAEKEYEIPQILDAADMVNCPDELSIMTYVSYFRDWDSEANKRRRAAEEAERQRKLKTADPSQCYAFGPGLEAGATNNDCPFTIQAVNYFGDKLPTGGDEFSINISGPDAPKATVKDNGNGTHSANYVPRLPGDYQVAITLRGEPIKGSPYGPVKITGPDARNSYADGPGVEGGRTNGPANFKIHSVGKDGRPVATGNDPYKVKVTGPDGTSLPATLKDNRNGTYDGSYNPTKPGRYTVDVTLNDEHIKNSPYHPLLENANSENSYAEGPGLVGGKTDHPLNFTIFARDADNRPVRNGGDPFVVNIKGPERVSPKVVDNNDGTYAVEYSVTTPGDYNIDVTLHDRPIKGSPYRPHIKPAADASKSYAEGPGLGPEVVDNEPAQFTIHAVDRFGQPRKDGGDPFEVKVKGPDGEETPRVIDNGDGTYGVTYNPNKPGPYVIDVTLEGKRIKDAPFRVNCKAGTDTALTTLTTFQFTVQTKDKHGNNKNFGGDSFEVVASGPASVSVRTQDNNNGSYTAIYTLPQRGTYRFAIKLNNKEIGCSPLTQSF